MALVTRYFSTTGAGAADGTTWADRAALFTAGTISTIITGFAFNGTDSLQVFFGPGTYTMTTAPLVGAFANPPTIANPLFMHGCDSSGNALVPSFWTCDTPVTWDSVLPVIATTTNIASWQLANSFIRMIKFTASGRNASMLSTCAGADWIAVENNTSNSSTSGVDTLATRCTNISIKMNGTIYGGGMSISNSGYFDNIRVQGNLSATSGNRNGYLTGGTTGARQSSRICSFNHPGGAYVDNSANVNANMWLINSVLANCGGSGVVGSATASQVQVSLFKGCMITGNGGYGLDANVSMYWATQNRLRNNTSGNFNGFTNYPTALNEVSAGSDAAEYVDATNGDFRIKYGSAIWGKGFGVSDQPNPSAGGGQRSYTF